MWWFSVGAGRVFSLARIGLMGSLPDAGFPGVWAHGVAGGGRS